MSEKSNIQDPHKIRSLQWRIKFAVYAFLLIMCIMLGILVSCISLRIEYFILSTVLLILAGLGIGYYVQEAENELNRRRSKPGPKIED